MMFNSPTLSHLPVPPCSRVYHLLPLLTLDTPLAVYPLTLSPPTSQRAPPPDPTTVAGVLRKEHVPTATLEGRSTLPGGADRLHGPARQTRRFRETENKIATLALSRLESATELGATPSPSVVWLGYSPTKSPAPMSLRFCTTFTSPLHALTRVHGLSRRQRISSPYRVQVIEWAMTKGT